MESLEVTTLAWGVTLGLILGLFALDLFISGRNPHAVEFKEAVGWSVFYIGVAVAFGVAFGMLAGWDYGAEYFAGYVVEKSLSIDNLFVFVVIMTTFAVPREYQQRVLTFGILGALILRAIFIALGAALLAAFSFMFLVFGLLLVFTAIQLFRHREEDPSIEDNAVVGFAQKRLPFTEDYGEGKLWTRENGSRVFTPLFLVLIAIATVDVLFALDSIPAIFGVTEEAYIVFAANAFALLGLRALFFLVSGLLDRLVYLSTGLSAILLFIGAKLILHWAHDLNKSIPEISIGFSLGVIMAILAIATIASLIKVRREPEAKAHAGSLRGHRSEERRQR